MPGAIFRPRARLDLARGRRWRLAGGRGRRRHLLVLERCLLQQLLLLFRDRGGDAVAPLLFEKGGILLVDFFLLFRRRIWARDIEAAILHEVVIGIAAARLAAPGEFR